MLSFFVMPTNALKSLRDELRIRMGDDVAREILYRYGNTIGSTVTKGMWLEDFTISELQEKMPMIWEQFGLGHLKISSMAENEIITEISDSIEGQALGHSSTSSCDFTAGYMAGMLSAILDKQTKNTELECICAGASSCRFRTEIFQERIVPRGEASSGDAMKFRIDEGISYLVQEETPDLSFELLLDMVTHDYEGICISRMFPKRVRTRYRLKETPVLWLCSEDGENCLSHPHLGKLYETIGSFLDESSRPVVLLDGFEYLITQNEYKSTLKFLQVMVENVAMKGGVLLLPINPSALDTKDLNLLKREMVVIKERKDLLDHDADSI